MAESNFDETGQVWPFFAITLLLLVLLPPTISGIVAIAGDATSRHNLLESIQDETDVPSLLPSSRSLIKTLRKKSLHKSKISFKTFSLVVGWILLIGLVYYATSQDHAAAISFYDPYDILGLSPSASEKEIKSHYKRLSLKFHPDKIRAVANQSIQDIEAQFIELTKAYKSLTDEVTRENFLKYGNPDGPEPPKHGIALPKFLVEGKGSPIVVASYTFLIGVGLPLLVARWWSGTRAYTKMGLHADTASFFFECLTKQNLNRISPEEILKILSGAKEFQIIVPGITPDQVLSYFESYMRRTTADNEAQKLSIVARSVQLIDGLLDIGAAFKKDAVIDGILRVSQCLIQAVPLDSPEVAQLPGVKLPSSSRDLTMAQLMEMDSQEQREALGFTKGDSDNKEFNRAIQVAKQMPAVQIISARFHVPGETKVFAKSIPHLEIKFRVIHPGDKPKPISEEEIAQEFKRQDEQSDPLSLAQPASLNTKAPKLSNMYAPYLPVYHAPRWYVTLGNPIDGRLAEGPAEISHLYTDTSKINTFRLPMQSPAPDEPGKFEFAVKLRSDSYNLKSVAQPATKLVVLEVIKVDEPSVPPIQRIKEIDDTSDNSTEKEQNDLTDRTYDTKYQYESSEDEYDEDEDSDQEAIFSDVNTDTEPESDDEENDEDKKKNGK